MQGLIDRLSGFHLGRIAETAVRDEGDPGKRTQGKGKLENSTAENRSAGNASTHGRYREVQGSTGKYREGARNGR